MDLSSGVTLKRYENATYYFEIVGFIYETITKTLGNNVYYCPTVIITNKNNLMNR